MKLCPFCRTQYSDDSLNYCLSDGTPLVKQTSQQDSPNTLLLPDYHAGVNLQTQNASLYPQTAQHPGAAATTPHIATGVPPKRSPVPWIIGGLILLGVIGTGIVVALMLSGVGKNQSSSNRSSASSNPSVNQNSNGNRPGTDSSPGQPYAAFADRTGSYEGNGLNTTHNVRGTIRLDITTINADSGSVAATLTSGGDLCGNASLTGKMAAEGRMNLSGPIICKATSYAGGMTVRCQFTATDTLSCTYTLKNPKGYEQATQQGNFKVTKR